VAFSKQPEISSYQTKPVPLLQELASRGSSTAKDSFMLNAYAEITKSKTTKEESAVLVKRAGTAQQVASTGTGVVRGIHFWALYDKFYVCIGRDVYVYFNNTAGNAFQNAMYLQSKVRPFLNSKAEVGPL